MRAVGPLVGLALLGALRTSHAQAGRPVPGDVVIVAVAADDLAPGTGGARLSADWLHPLPRGSIRAGLESATTSGLMRWVVGRIGGGWRVNERLSGDVLGSLGPGSLGGDRFWYRQVQAAAAYAVMSERLFLEADAQAFDIAGVRGQIVAGGVTALPRPAVQARLTYGRSAGGNYESEYLVARVDYRRGDVGILGGCSAGRSGPTPQELSLAASPNSRREIFAGVVIPVRGLELTAVLSHAWGEAVRRESILLTTRIPLR